MYLIAIKVKKGLSHLNAIFKNKADAEAWYTKLPDIENKKNLELIEISIESYPLYILSNIGKDPLRYEIFTNNLSQIEKELKAIKRENDEDRIYCNLYIIKEDATNTHNPMESCINGRTTHHHINNNFLEEMDERGLKQVLS